MRNLWITFCLFGLFWLRPALAQTEAVQKDGKAAQPGASLTEDERIDQYAILAPREATQSVKKLAEYLGKQATTDRAKARAIFIWMDSNLTYDMDNYLKPGGQSETRPEVVLNSPFRTTVCAGYAELFAALAKEMGLEAEIVSGDARFSKKSSSWSKPAGPDLWTEGHAWNAVKIDGQWQLLDATWGNPRRKVEGKLQPGGRIDYDYFLLPAEALAYTHLPEDAKWQLLDKPLTREQFLNLPLLTPAFFRYGGKIISHPERTIQVKDSLCITIELDKNATFQGELVCDDKPLTHDHILIQHTEKGFEVHVAIPRAGTYELRFYATAIGAEKSLWPHIATYRVIAEAGTRTRFPAQYSRFVSSKAFLYAPLNGVLDSSQPQKFKIKIPGATRAFINSGVKYTPLKKQGDCFTGEVLFDPCNVSIAAEFPDEPNFHDDLAGYVFR